MDRLWMKEYEQIPFHEFALSSEFAAKESFSDLWKIRTICNWWRRGSFMCADDEIMAEIQIVLCHLNDSFMLQKQEFV
ncbi:hypothetical protein R1flu_007761 [Riccia fluitans]|uniref:Uncharacterized protein n=1 Tax=Riccia fluitans TaxID=41844 RepID=A0ABD1Z2U4_9MARC